MSRLEPTVDLGYPTGAHDRIPSFNNVDGEAAFWDTDEVTDYLDESQSAELTAGVGHAEKLTLQLDHNNREALGRRAKRLPNMEGT